MAEIPDINTVETDEDYIHVRFRDPDQFDEIRSCEGDCWSGELAL